MCAMGASLHAPVEGSHGCVRVRKGWDVLEIEEFQRGKGPFRLGPVKLSYHSREVGTVRTGLINREELANSGHSGHSGHS